MMQSNSMTAAAEVTVGTVLFDNFYGHRIMRCPVFIFNKTTRLTSINMIE